MMQFSIKNPPINRMLATLDPDIMRAGPHEEPVATYTRLAAEGTEASIGSDTAEIQIDADVTTPGVAFLRTSLVREMLESFVGKELPLRFELEETPRGTARVRFSDRGGIALQNEWCTFPDPTTAPHVAPANLYRGTE